MTWRTLSTPELFERHGRQKYDPGDCTRFPLETALARTGERLVLGCDFMKQRQVLAGNGLDREFSLDAAACGAAHLNCSVVVLPLFEDDAGQRSGVIRGRKPSFHTIGDEPAIARNCGGDKGDPEGHGFQKRDAHAFLA